jgi:PAS domain S-box-containing protein
MEGRFSIEKTSQAVFWADPETGLIINCNRAAETLLENKKKEIIGFPQTNLYPPQKAEYYGGMFKNHIEQHGTADIEAEVIASSGSAKTCSYHRGRYFG